MYIIPNMYTICVRGIFGIRSCGSTRFVTMSPPCTLNLANAAF